MWVKHHLDRNSIFFKYLLFFLRHCLPTSFLCYWLTFTVRESSLILLLLLVLGYVCVLPGTFSILGAGRLFGIKRAQLSLPRPQCVVVLYIWNDHRKPERIGRKNFYNTSYFDKLISVSCYSL